MTQCEAIAQYFDAYLDMTLDQPSRSRLDNHLNQCAACRQRLNQAAAIEQQIRDVASTWTPSEGLWARIKEGDENQLQRSSDRITPQKFAGTAAVIVLCTFAFATYFLLSPSQILKSESTAVALVNEFHTFVVSRRELDYSEPLPMNVREWFGDKVEFRVPLPVSTPKFTLAGGRLCNMFDQRIVSFMYRVDGAWVSLYIMQSAPDYKLQEMGKQLLVHGYGYVEWQQQGLHYSLVGDVPADHLRHIAERLSGEDVSAKYSGSTGQPYLSPSPVRI